MHIIHCEIHRLNKNTKMRVNGHWKRGEKQAKSASTIYTIAYHQQELQNILFLLRLTPLSVNSLQQGT